MAGSSKDNSVVLHTSSPSSASTVQTGGRGGCCLKSFASVLSSVNHSRLLYERGKRSVQSRSPGRMSAIRWRREGRRNGKRRESVREEEGGKGKLKGRRSRRRRKRRGEIDRNACAEIKEME